MSAKFSVLMSVYILEQPEYLFTSLESIFNQTCLPDEVVLVQDGPLTDGLYKIISDFIQRYPSLKTISLPQNVGLGSALNEGLRHCSNHLVARMDSDDICKTNRFEEQLKVFAAKPELSVVGSWVDEFSSDPSIIASTRKLPQMPEQVLAFAHSKSPLNHPSVMFKKSTILSVGGYLPFYLFEDYFLWARLLNSGYLFYNIPESLVLMRTGNGLFARRGGWKYAKSEIRLQREFLKMGFIGYFTFMKNVTIRFTVRMMPNKLRAFVYKKLLR